MVMYHVEVDRRVDGQTVTTKLSAVSAGGLGLVVASAIEEGPGEVVAVRAWDESNPPPPAVVVVKLGETTRGEVLTQAWPSGRVSASYRTSTWETWRPVEQFGGTVERGT